MTFYMKFFFISEDGVGRVILKIARFLVMLGWYSPLIVPCKLQVTFLPKLVKGLASNVLKISNKWGVSIQKNVDMN